MRKLFYILFIISLNSAGQTISHDQYYITTDSASDNDYVGQWYVNCYDTIFNTRSGSYSYSITAGNTGNAFAINSSTGMITLADHTAISGGDDFSLTIRTSIDSDSEDNTAYIHVLYGDSCLFVDFSESGAGAGGPTDPHDNWEADIQGLKLDTISGVLFKRGTTCQDGDDLYIVHYPMTSKKLYIGAYGTGDLPLIDGDGTNTSNAILLGTGYNCAGGDVDSVRQINFYDIRAANFDLSTYPYAARGIRSTAGCHDIEMNRCVLDSFGDNGCYWFEDSCGSLTFNDNIVLRDCFAHYNISSHLYKIECGDFTGINLYGERADSGNFMSCISMPSNSIDGFYARDIGVKSGAGGFVLRSGRHTIQNGYIKNAHTGIWMYDDPIFSPDTCVFNNIWILDTRVWGMMIEDADSLIFTDVKVYNGDTIGIYLDEDNDGIIFDKCQIYNNAAQGILVLNSTNDNITFQRSLIYRNDTAFDIRDFADSMTVYNCTIYENGATDVCNTSDNSVTYTNNIDKNRTGNFTVTTCLDYDAFMDSDYFTDTIAGQEDFTLLVGAAAAIETGTDVSFTEDIREYLIQGAAPEIGAYERITDRVIKGYVDKWIIINNRKFVIK